jgi:hypothetical protein
MQFVRIRTFSIWAHVGANLAAVVDPSFFSMYTIQLFSLCIRSNLLIKWWCGVGAVQGVSTYLLLDSAWVTSKFVTYSDTTIYLLIRDLTEDKGFFHFFKFGQRTTHSFMNSADTFLEFCHPINSWVVFTRSLSFFEWKPRWRMKKKWSTSQNQ